MAGTVVVVMPGLIARIGIRQATRHFIPNWGGVRAQFGACIDGVYRLHTAFQANPTVVVPPGGNADAIFALPTAALRLPANIADNLRKLGLDRILDIAAKPRAPLTLRFGPELGRRLDQAAFGLSGPDAKNVLRAVFSACKRSNRVGAGRSGKGIEDPHVLDRILNRRDGREVPANGVCESLDHQLVLIHRRQFFLASAPVLVDDDHQCLRKARS